LREELHRTRVEAGLEPPDPPDRFTQLVESLESRINDLQSQLGQVIAPPPDPQEQYPQYPNQNPNYPPGPQGYPQGYGHNGHQQPPPGMQHWQQQPPQGFQQWQDPQFVQQAPPPPPTMVDDMANTLKKMNELKQMSQMMGFAPAEGVDQKIKEIEQQMQRERQAHAEMLVKIQMDGLRSEIAELKKARTDLVPAASAPTDIEPSTPPSPFEDVNGIKIPKDPETGELDYDLGKIAKLNGGAILEQGMALFSLYNDRKESELKHLQELARIRYQGQPAQLEGQGQAPPRQVVESQPQQHDHDQHESPAASEPDPVPRAQARRPRRPIPLPPLPPSPESYQAQQPAQPAQAAQAAQVVQVAQPVQVAQVAQVAQPAQSVPGGVVGREEDEHSEEDEEEEDDQEVGEDSETVLDQEET
jgi:hypothetical protein